MITTFEETTEIRRIAIYIRVSTAEQKLSGYSLDAQKKKLAAHVNAHAAQGWQTKQSWIYEDVHTGSDLNRKELNRLREDVKAAKYDAVLVWKIDRLSRCLKHLILVFEELQENNASFVSVQENIDFKGPIGNLIFQIFGAIAQFERELIKGRTQMGKIASAEAGNFTGTNFPYGYRKMPNPKTKGSILEIIPEEKKWVKQIYDWCIYEGFGEGQIAKKMNELKVPKKNHKHTKRASIKWTNVMVRTILTNPLYRGDFVANRKDEEGQIMSEDQWTVVAFPPCISELTFFQAQEARRKRKGGSTDTDYMLTGKLIDMDLEKPKRFSGAGRHKGGFSYRRKQFDKKVNGKMKHYKVFEIPGQQIENFVWNKVMDALKNPEIFIKKYLSKQYTEPGMAERYERDLAAYRAAKVNEELAIARIEAAFEEGAYSQEKMEKKIQERNKVLIKLDDNIIEAEDRLKFMSCVDIEIHKLKDVASQVQYRLDNLDRRQKKILCNLFVDKVEMRRRKVHNRWKAHAEVHLRFNPQKFAEGMVEGRTTKDSAVNKKASSEAKNLKHGGRWRT
ncbi:MAG: recombinase family protein [Candidatus Peribacteraceae bacterium]|nr:recombinase family protein [Candidatus Peribacteraceae bacterium]